MNALTTATMHAGQLAQAADAIMRQTCAQNETDMFFALRDVEEAAVSAPTGDSVGAHYQLCMIRESVDSLESWVKGDKHAEATAASIKGQINRMLDSLQAYVAAASDQPVPAEIAKHYGVERP